MCHDPSRRKRGESIPLCEKSLSPSPPPAANLASSPPHRSTGSSWDLVGGEDAGRAADISYGPGSSVAGARNAGQVRAWCPGKDGDHAPARPAGRQGRTIVHQQIRACRPVLRWLSRASRPRVGLSALAVCPHPNRLQRRARPAATHTPCISIFVPVLFFPWTTDAARPSAVGA